MKVTVKRKNNVGTMKQPYSIIGVKKPIASNGKHQIYHAVARTQAIPPERKGGAQ